MSLVAVISVMLSVSAFAAAPVITSQPQNVYLPPGTELPIQVTFSVMATGDNLSYQWQSSYDNGITWNNGSSTSESYSPSINVGNVNGQRLFRVVITNSDGEVSSSVVSVNVGAYLLESIPQMIFSVSQVINSIFDWVGSACACIIDSSLLLIGVSFFALGASIAILSRLLSRR